MGCPILVWVVGWCGAFKGSRFGVEVSGMGLRGLGFGVGGLSKSCE